MSSIQDQPPSSLCSVTLRALRAVIFKPLYKCFIHTLRAVNPDEAARVEASLPQPRRGSRAGKADRRTSDTAPLPRFEHTLSGPYRVRWACGVPVLRC